MGAIADKLHKFVDTEDTSGNFESYPEDAADAQEKWSSALKDGIKELMAITVGLGLGQGVPPLKGVDDAIDAHLVISVFDGTGLKLPVAIDNAMSELATKVKSNSANSIMAPGGFQTNPVNPPSASDFKSQDLATAGGGDPGTKPFVEDGLITAAEPAVLAPEGSPCGTPLADEGTPAVNDTGFDMANRLEAYISAWLLTGTFQLVSPPPASFPIGPFPWIMPAPGAEKGEKIYVVIDMEEGMKDNIDIESIDPEFEGEGGPMDLDGRKGLFQTIKKLYELTVYDAALDEDVITEGRPNQEIKETALVTAQTYLGKLREFLFVTGDGSSSNPYLLVGTENDPEPLTL